jgi:hypothetical protein
MPDAVHELIATEAVLVKLGARGITIEDVDQLPPTRTSQFGILAPAQTPESGG